MEINQISDEEELKKIPKIIAMSGGRADTDPIIPELENMGIEFLEKPFNIGEMLVEINNVVVKDDVLSNF